MNKGIIKMEQVEMTFATDVGLYLVWFVYDQMLGALSRNCSTKSVSFSSSADFAIIKSFQKR